MRRDEEGSTLVEVALLLPILLLLLAGTAELGRALYNHHALSKAVRDSSRFLARVADPTDAGFKAMAVNYVRTGSFAGTADALVGLDPDAIQVTFSENEIGNDPMVFYGPKVVRIVTVEARYAFHSGLLRALGLAGEDGIPMTVSHVQRHIGQ